jgi:hypothetical protein
MTIRAYDLVLPRLFKAWLVFFGLFSVGIPVLLLSLGREPTGPPWFVPILFLGVLGFAWYKMLSIPHRIEVHADERIEFIAVLRRRIIPVADFLSVRPHRSQFGFLVFRYSGGKVVIANQFTGFHQLLSEVAARNPSIELLGC